MASVLGSMAVAGALAGGCSSGPAASEKGELASSDAGVLARAGGASSDRLAPDGGPVRLAVSGVALRSSEVVPGPGVVAGSGWVEVEVREDRGEVCVEITVRSLDQPSAVHLHEGEVGETGEVVLALPAPPHGDGSVDACVSASAEVIERLQDDLDGFYVNVHTVAASDGAVRGQLG